MENSTFSRELAVTSHPLRADGVRRRYRIPTFLKGYKGLLTLAAATGILAGWTWFGTAAVLPLLYILPCAAMLAMCMKGHGGAGSSPDKTDAGGNGGAAGSS